jgi:Holliday junction resolvase RusA-like endonuclease
MIINRLRKRNSIDNDPCIITILGEPASKANSRRFVAIGGKPRFIKSKKALDYTKSFKIQCPGRKKLFEEDLFVAIKIYYRSRRPDLDASLILDLLQDYVYPNDRLVKGQYIEWGLDKDNPRSLIVITTLDKRDLALEKLSELVSSKGES